jgi:hypothetical protein
MVLCWTWKHKQWEGYKDLQAAHILLASVLRACFACLQLFEDYRKVYDFGRTWSHEEYISKV